MDRPDSLFSEQLTFTEKMIEADLQKFEQTGDIKYYKSAKNMSEQEKAPYVFGSIKKKLGKNPELSLKMNLTDGSYWNCLQIIAQNQFPVNIILGCIYYIHKHTDAEDFDLLTELASEKLFKYIFIGDNSDNLDIEEIKERNRFILVTLSYFNLINMKTEAEIEQWEISLEEAFRKDEELAKSYNKYWQLVKDYCELPRHL